MASTASGWESSSSAANALLVIDRMLELSSEITAGIAEHARRSYPGECCGVLLGRFAPLQVTQAIAGRNLQSTTTRYLLDPRDIIAADRLAGQRGLEIVGFYHSHPESQAVPSAADRSAAWPGYLYLIAAVCAGRPVALRGWIFDTQRGEPRELVLRTTSPQGPGDADRAASS